MMQVEEDGSHHRSYDNSDAGQSPDSANLIEGGTEITVAIDVLIAVPSQALTSDNRIFRFALCVQLIAHIPTASFAGKLIHYVERSRKRPLLRPDLSSTHIAHLGLLHLHLPLSTRQMLMFRKVILAEAVTAIWTASQCLLVTFMATACGMDSVWIVSWLSLIVHIFVLPRRLLS
jgi:hypothetical protein